MATKKRRRKCRRGPSVSINMYRQQEQQQHNKHRIQFSFFFFLSLQSVSHSCYMNLFFFSVSMYSRLFDSVSIYMQTHLPTPKQHNSVYIDTKKASQRQILKATDASISTLYLQFCMVISIANMDIFSVSFFLEFLRLG